MVGDDDTVCSMGDEQPVTDQLLNSTILLRCALATDAKTRRSLVCQNRRVCDCYQLSHLKQMLAEHFDVSSSDDGREPRHNIAPTQMGFCHRPALSPQRVLRRMP
jgi:hypothetical protein